jgi:hypothetical protein
MSLAFVALCLVIVWAVKRSEDSKLEDHAVCSPVARIGGCNKWGRCGVLLANGTKRDELRPVVGEMICYRPAKR